MRSASSPHLFGPWRFAFQMLTTALVVSIPFIRINGMAMARIDIPALTMELVGHRFRIEEFFLVWLAVLGGVFLFVLLTLALGRVWCGWACPQTTLSDLTEWLLRKRALRPFRYPICLLLGLLVGANVVWYFLPPYEFASRLVKGQLGVWPTGTVLAIALLVFVDLAFVRRLFCREFCPYGRFQTVLTDKGTLTLQAHPAHLNRCLDCKACVRVCPTGIDIRQGYQIECLNCARCLDACRKVMAKRGEEGIIRYTFGQADLGWGALWTPKITGLILLVMVLAGTAFYQASHRATASFKIGRSSLVASRLTEGGRQLTFFSGSIANRREGATRFKLAVSTPQGQPLVVKGPVDFSLAGNEKRDLNLAVESDIIAGPDPRPITFTLSTAEDERRIEIKAFLSPFIVSGQPHKE